MLGNRTLAKLKFILFTTGRADIALLMSQGSLALATKLRAQEELVWCKEFENYCFIYLKQVKVKPWRVGLLYLMKLKPSFFKYFKKHKLVSKIGLRFVIWEISCETVGTPCHKDDENKLANSDSRQQLHWL